MPDPDYPTGPTRILSCRPADDEHQVVTVAGPIRHCRHEPCPHCPWRQDQPVGRFPAEAFRHSAETAYDMSDHVFGCHMSGTAHPETCAGFLLSGATHNLAIRLALIIGKLDTSTVSTPVLLYPSYRAMAEANGVPPDDPTLAPCR
jgi:hypothetical protein